MTAVRDTEELRDLHRNAPLPLIAARIKRARRATGMSHDALGERMGGVTRQHLIKLEKGRHRPTLEMLDRIASATGKCIDYFLVEEAGEPNPFPAEAI